MFILLFLFWIILNGRLTLDVVVFGLAISAGLTLFTRKFLGLSRDRDREFFSEWRRLAAYVFYLIGEVIKANFAVIRRILTFSEPPDPVLVKFDSDIKGGTAKALLANSITLTPGTITVDIDGDDFMVHALEREYAVDIDRSGFVERLEAMEGEKREQAKRRREKEGK